MARPLPLLWLLAVLMLPQVASAYVDPCDALGAGCPSSSSRASVAPPPPPPPDFQIPPPASSSRRSSLPAAALPASAAASSALPVVPATDTDANHAAAPQEIAHPTAEPLAPSGPGTIALVVAVCFAVYCTLAYASRSSRAHE